MAQMPPSDPNRPLAPPQHPGPMSPDLSAPTRTSGLAIVSLVLACIGFCFFPLGIVGLILGIVAIGQIDRPENRLSGRGLATAGAIVGGVGAAFGVILMLIAILLPALGAARTTARRMQNSTQLRGIHQGLVLDSQANKGFYVGMDPTGKIVDPAVEGRLKSLMDGGYFTPDYLISPGETQTKRAWTGGALTAGNYSYALLAIDEATVRTKEWKETTNSQAIVLGDRNIGPGTGDAQVQSIWTHAPGNWEGNVVWNDNHTVFEASHQVTTYYGNRPGGPVLRDNLFEQDVPDGGDALMIHSGK